MDSYSAFCTQEAFVNDFCYIGVMSPFLDHNLDQASPDVADAYFIGNGALFGSGKHGAHWAGNTSSAGDRVGVLLDLCAFSKTV